MLGYIERGHAAGYRVVVANPNEAEEDPVAHVVGLWEDLLAAGAAPGSIDVVAHSNGGRCFLGLLCHLVEDCGADQKPLQCLGKIACTDSYHSPQQVSRLENLVAERDPATGCDAAAVTQLLSSVRNYVCSPQAFGTEVASWMSLKNKITAKSRAPMKCISCEVDDHASTNYAAEAAIFEWFGQ